MTKFIRRKNKNTPLKDPKAKVLSQIRQLRGQIETENPGLLDEICKLYEASQKQERIKQAQIPNPKEDADPNPNLSIDKKKNLETVVEFVQMKTGSDDFQKRLKDMLLKSLN